MNEKRTVYCEVCDNSDYGTVEELSKTGWLITEKTELCPNCRS